MTIAILLGAVAMFLGVLCCWLVYLVHTRYRFVNASNEVCLNDLASRVRELERGNP